MNKTIKIMVTLLMTMLLIVTLSQACLANSSTYTQIVSEIDTGAQGAAKEVGGLKTVAGKIVKIIRNVAAIAAVVIISIFGIKYMIGSTEEKADYKKSFIPLIVGVVVVFSAAEIAKLLFNVV